jgi:hypothetical protein
VQGETDGADDAATGGGGCRPPVRRLIFASDRS